VLLAFRRRPLPQHHGQKRRRSAVPALRRLCVVSFGGWHHTAVRFGTGLASHTRPQGPAV